MEDFVGTWDVEEKTFHGHRILKNRPVVITIVKNAIPNKYDVKIPLQRGELFFTKAPNGQTISHISTLGKKSYEVRLVFDHNANPAQIVGELGGSMILRWSHNLQPDDVGTITGTRG